MNKKLAETVRKDMMIGKTATKKIAKGQNDKELLKALQEYKKGCTALFSYFESLDDSSVFFDKVEKNNISYYFIPRLSFDVAIREIDKLISVLQKEQKAEEPKQKEKQTKTVYSVELFNDDGDTEKSIDCQSYDEAIEIMEKYKRNKDQYIDSWGLSGKGRIIKFTEDVDGNMSNEKVLKTFWL